MTTLPTEPPALRNEADVTGWLAGGFQCLPPPARTPSVLARLLRVLDRQSAEGEPTLAPPVLRDVLRFVEPQDRFNAPPERTNSARVGAARDVGSLPAALRRRYEDQVVGRLSADAAFQRAAVATARYRGDERVVAEAFLASRFRDSTGVPGMLLGAAAVRRLAAGSVETLCREWSAMAVPSDVVLGLEQTIEQARAAVRAATRLVAPEDLFELERGTAVRPFAERLALRQVLQAAELLSAGLPPRLPRRTTAGSATPVPVAEEDLFPAGGWSSITTRGSIESLLQSQFALQEPDQRPDLFDARFVRDELLYYSRDDGRFHRPRRTLFLAFDGGLAAARVKDADAPFQRTVMLCGAIVAVVRATTRWLSDQSLRFEFVFPAEKTGADLTAERELLRRALVLEVERGLVGFHAWNADRLGEEWRRAERRSVCRGVRFAAGPLPADAIGGTFPSFHIHGCAPRLEDDVRPLPHRACPGGEMTDQLPGGRSSVAREVQGSQSVISPPTQGRWGSGDGRWGSGDDPESHETRRDGSSGIDAWRDATARVAIRLV